VGGVVKLKLPGTPDVKGDAKTGVKVTAKPAAGYPQINVSTTPLGAGAKTLKPKTFFDAARDKSVQMLKAKVVSEKDVKLDNYEGHEFTLAVPGPSSITITSVTRLYVVGTTAVTIVATYPEGKVDGAVIEAFHDSVKAIAK